MLTHTMSSSSGMATQRQAALPAVPATAMAGCPLHLQTAPARALLHRQPLTAGRRQQICRGQRTVVAASAAAAAPAAQKIRIKLSSFNVPLLTESVDLIKTAAFETGARLSGPVPLPMRKRVYTVLRSPHVNKDSREQFERRTHFRLMDLHELSSQTVDRLMQLDLPAGVDIDVKLL